MCTPNNRT